MLKMLRNVVLFTQGYDIFFPEKLLAEDFWGEKSSEGWWMGAVARIYHGGQKDNSKMLFRKING